MKINYESNFVVYSEYNENENEAWTAFIPEQAEVHTGYIMQLKDLVRAANRHDCGEFSVGDTFCHEDIRAFRRVERSSLISTDYMSAFGVYTLNIDQDKYNEFLSMPLGPEKDEFAFEMLYKFGSLKSHGWDM